MTVFVLFGLLACAVLVASAGRVFADSTPTLVKPLWIIVVGMVGEATVTAERSGIAALVFFCVVLGMWGVVECSRGALRRVVASSLGPLGRAGAHYRTLLLTHPFLGASTVAGLTALAFFAVEYAFNHDVAVTAIPAAGVWALGAIVGYLGLRGKRTSSDAEQVEPRERSWRR